MDPKRTRVLNAYEGSIWAMEPRKLAEVSGVVQRRVVQGLKLSAAEVSAATRSRPMASRGGAVAVLPLFGIIGQRMDMMMAWSGGTSTEAFAREFDAALRDENVAAIVIDIDSPGGSVAGVPELAARIYNARGTKPVVAVANSMMCSAAYWIGSAADEVVCTSMAMVGSVNAIMVRIDMTAADEQSGIAYHFITGGQTNNKAEGNPHLPFTAEELEATQANVDVAYNAFVNAVARHRGVTPKAVREQYGEGRVFVGERALEAKLADRIATLDEVVNELAAGRKPGGARASVTTAQIVASTTVRVMEPADKKEQCEKCGAEMEEGECPDCAPDEDMESTAADGAAAATAQIPEPTPAPEARSEAMSDKPVTAAPENGADQIAAERKRVADLYALGAKNEIHVDTVQGWVDRGVSVKDAEYICEQRAALAQKPGVRAAVRPGANRVEQDPRKGFASHREFLMAAMDASGLRDRSQVADERLRVLAVNSGDEDKQARGELAFLLPEAFTPQSLRATAGSDEQGLYDDRYGGFIGNTTSVLPGLLTTPTEGDPTAGRTQPLPMATPSVTINARTDKDHTTSVSGGFVVTRRPETVDATSSRMQTEQITLKATSLFGLAFATEELLSDSPISFAALIQSGFADQYPAHILNEKIRGNGGAEFLGVKNSPAKVAVAKETNQAAATIVANNIIKMAARSYGFGQSIWMANHDTRPQLATMSIAVGTGGVLLYQPSQTEGFPDMLWGRPVFYTEFCDTVGTEGDLMLVNWSQYLEGVYQPLQSAESVHVRFVSHERAFKFWMRNAGAPWWRAPLTPNKGSNTLSPIVTLAVRS